jgi:hypothetical protein
LHGLSRSQVAALVSPSWLTVNGEPFPPLRVESSAGGREMGKFFLVIVALSVAILLAMSAYVISL